MPESIKEPASESAWDRWNALTIGVVFLAALSVFGWTFGHGKGFTPESVLQASHRFPYAAFKTVHRFWTIVDALRAWGFFVLLALLGMAAPLRGRMSPRWVLVFIAGCYAGSRFFVPSEAPALLDATHWLSMAWMNVAVSLGWTIVFTAWWAKRQSWLPVPIAASLGISLAMSAHALASLFYVFH